MDHTEYLSILDGRPVPFVLRVAARSKPLSEIPRMEDGPVAYWKHAALSDISSTDMGRDVQFTDIEVRPDTHTFPRK